MGGRRRVMGEQQNKKISLRDLKKIKGSERKTDNANDLILCVGVNVRLPVTHSEK